MFTPTTTIIWRRNREAIKARVAAKKAEDDAYRQQFIDAAKADEAAKQAAATAKTQAQQAQQQQQKRQQSR